MQVYPLGHTGLKWHSKCKMPFLIIATLYAACTSMRKVFLLLINTFSYKKCQRCLKLSHRRCWTIGLAALVCSRSSLCTLVYKANTVCTCHTRRYGLHHLAFGVCLLSMNPEASASSTATFSLCRPASSNNCFIAVSMSSCRPLAICA